MPKICSLSRYLNTASDFARNYTGSPIPSGVGDGGISYNGLHREVVLERGTLFRIPVYERVKESVISVCKRAQLDGLPHVFYGFEQFKKTFWLPKKHLQVNYKPNVLYIHSSLHCSLSLSFPPKGSGYCFNL